MIRFTPTENSNPKVGDILLSEPFLNDPFFGRKAILLCENNEDGSFGLVLNNIIDVDVEEILKDFPDKSARISLGGPVSRSNMFFIHNSETIEGSNKIVEGIYLGGDFESLKEMICSNIKGFKYRFFIGYSGWSKGQLHEEIKTRSWFVTIASSELIMNSSDENEKVWKTLIKKMGDGYNHIADAPIDPTLN